MSGVSDLMQTNNKFVRKWGPKILALADYSTPVPEAFFTDDGLPVLPPTFKQLGYVTTDGVSMESAISSEATNMDQDVAPVRTDLTGIEKTLAVTFGETNAYTKALYHGRAVSEWGDSPYVPTVFDDSAFVDFPYYRLLLLASDGVGDDAFYRVEFGYRAKVTAGGARQLARAAVENRQFTFGLFKDPATGAAHLEAENGPGFGSDSVAATSATAGTPGAFGPAGSLVPEDLATLQGSAVTASPATAWNEGDYVELGNGSKAHWTGSAWAAGAAEGD